MLVNTRIIWQCTIYLFLIYSLKCQHLTNRIELLLGSDKALWPSQHMCFLHYSEVFMSSEMSSYLSVVI